MIEPEDIYGALFGPEAKAEIDKAKMKVSAEAHDIYAWFDHADKENLIRMKQIIGTILNASTSHSGAVMQAAWFQGYVTAKLNQHHNICPACSTDHMDELLSESEG